MIGFFFADGMLYVVYDERDLFTLEMLYARRGGRGEHRRLRDEGRSEGRGSFRGTRRFLYDVGRVA